MMNAAEHLVGVYRSLCLILGVLFLILLLSSPAGAFTLNVVDTNGAAVSGFRWLLEEDNTNLTVPGALVSDSISVDIHKSHAPVEDKGHEDGSFALINADARKRYFVSVLPDAGYSMGGTSVAVGHDTVTVTVHPYEVNGIPVGIPTAQISLIAFVDHNPVNNLKDDQDAGLGGCTVIISDAAGQVMQDAFGNPLGTQYEFDPVTGSPVFNADGPVVSVRGNGSITTLSQEDFLAAIGAPDDPLTPEIDPVPPDPTRNPYNLQIGEALIKYLVPGKYGVVVTPPGIDPAGNPLNWTLTSTIEGTSTVDAWVKANEPRLFVEGFGTGFQHTFYAFVNPDGSATTETPGLPNFTNPNGAAAGLGLQRDVRGNLILDVNGNPFPVIAPLNWVGNPPAGTGTITGTLRLNHFSRPPTLQGFFAGPPVPSGWIALNNPNIMPGIATAGGPQPLTSGLYAAPCDPETGEFTITGVPPGTYQLVNWDTPLDYLIGFHTVTVGEGEAVVLGDVLVFRWFGTFQGTVFLDDGGGDPAKAGNGFQDPGEIGLAEQNVNIRFRDGTIYQAQPTDVNGGYELGRVFPFFKWLVPEVDFARFKATGMTSVVDYGGEVLPHNGWIWPSFDKLYPQPQATINPNTANNLARTETGPVLTQAMHLFLGQTNVIDWGKAMYGPGENGGISGIVFYATTRAEDDPRYAVGEPWEPGIPRVQVNLYRDWDNDQLIDDKDGNGRIILADVNNPPLNRFPGPEDIDRNRNRIFDFGDAINVTWTDSWDDNQPSGCVQALPIIHGRRIKECADGFGTWNQIRPGVFDGGYAFDSYFPRGKRGEVNGLPTGNYIVEAVPPPGYELVKEEDKNVDFGDSYVPSTQLLPPVCVGDDHLVPPELSLFPGVPAALAGQTRPLCDKKEVLVVDGQNAAADFFFFTEVPKAARALGFVNNDLAAEFNQASPVFGEKLAAAWLPISFKDWTGKELTRVYTDEFGGYNAMLPSTYTVNVASPTGVSPNMVTAVLNDPTLPDGTLDPFYDPTYSVTTWTLQYMPGTTTYLDTPIVPLAAFAASEITIDTLPADGEPVIRTVDGPGGGPLLCTDLGENTVTITSNGLTRVLNPAYDPTLPPRRSQPRLITRDFGFGATQGTVTLDGTELAVVSWSATSIVATVPPGTTSGRLLVTRGDNGATTRLGVTLNLENCATTGIARVPADFPSIQAAIDDLGTVAGDLILVSPGVYNENVIMYKPVRLQGSGAGSTVINANPVPLERLALWHERIETPTDQTTSDGHLGLGGANFLGFIMRNPFAENEAPGIIVIGELQFPGGNLLVPDPLITTTLNPGNPFSTPGQASIDGFTISGSKGGGGIFAVAGAGYLTISNNEVTNNQGNYAGGIIIGTQDTAFDAHNNNIVIRNNLIHKNGGVQGPGGIALNDFSTDYLVEENLITGNFSRFHGGGIQHRGFTPGNNIIRKNRILFNENFFGAILARAGDGGGIHIGGDVAGGTGAGNVTIDGNLIQGNMTGSGSGGGIRVFALSGDDVRSLGEDPPGTLYELKIVNNIIVNNVAGLDGAGISLQDAVRVTIANNTIANNDSTATGALAFAPGALNSTPQPAGIATHGHSDILQFEIDNQIALGNLAPGEPTFSNPALQNNILWHNRSFFNDASLNGGAGGLSPSSLYAAIDPLADYPDNWDLQVVGNPGVMNPDNCILSELTRALLPGATVGPAWDYNDGSNLSPDPTGQRIFLKEYQNRLRSATILDEGGNAISVLFEPLDPSAGNYHISCASPAADAGGAAILPEQATDIDGEARPNPDTSLIDIGADEFHVFFTPETTLVTPNGGEIVASGSQWKICWSAPEEATTFQLAYSLNNGSSWRLIASGLVERSFLWDVPTLQNNKTKVLVRVKAFNSAGRAVGSDRSDRPFKIEVVRLLSPNGGETLNGAETFNITWMTNGTLRPVNTTLLHYSLNGGQTWRRIDTPLPGNPGSYSWQVPSLLRTKNRVHLMVTLKDAGGKIVGRDRTDAVFSINAVP